MAGMPSPYQVIPIKGGSTNYTYRIICACSSAKKSDQSSTAQTTMIIKYAPPYAVITPNIPFTPERQEFEAFAMQELALALRRLASTTIVTLPRLIFHDRTNHILAMEDVGLDATSSEKKQETSTISLKDFCKSSSITSNDITVADRVGTELGKFLFGLHHCGRSIGLSESDKLRETFVRNAAARQLDVDTTFGDILRNLDEFQVTYSADEKRILERLIQETSFEIMNNFETIIMGDFWYGNILLKFQTGAELRDLTQIGVIDWEFTTCGPLFVDLAHFASEIWLQDRFHLNNGLASIANRKAAVSLFASYRACGGYIDCKKIALYIGGHVCCFLRFTNWTDDMEHRKTVAREAIDLMLAADSKNWASVNNSFIRELFEL
ncbi:kinase-like domain-containing protein [Xylaria sp. FL1777]|nr:kinase-like domain-containing protein [Xylaria sp. FL1777]